MLLLTVEYLYQYTEAQMKLWDSAIPANPPCAIAVVPFDDIRKQATIWAKQFKQPIVSLTHCSGYTQLSELDSDAS